ncbi:hypothetical protein MKX03_021171 [Papaver bracteatum]|nr:hypothetical protein MKX03_021171 [Papaver bracteatum]
MCAAESNHYKKLLGHHQGGFADLPPRKQLLTRRSSNLMIPSISFDDHDDDHIETVLMNFPHKFLPCNNTTEDDDDDENDPYANDEFRIYEFKIRSYMRSRSHDWNDCPFAHPDGRNCKRKVCFFAHTPKKLRVLVPPHDSPRTKPHHHN